MVLLQQQLAVVPVTMRTVQAPQETVAPTPLRTLRRMVATRTTRTTVGARTRQLPSCGGECAITLPLAVLTWSLTRVGHGVGAGVGLGCRKEWRKQDKRMGRGDTALAVACLGGDERYSMVELLSNEQYGAETINIASQVRCRARPWP